MATWHTMPAEQTLSALETDVNAGIPEDEALLRLEKYGRNVLPEAEPISPMKIFLSQFKDIMVIVLIIAALVSAFIGYHRGTVEEWYDAIVIGIIVVVNAIFGFFQEYRAEKSLQALRAMSSPRAEVIRGGKVTVIDSSLLVPGDIVLLKAGGKVPADIRLVEAINLRVNEASLTGESREVTKDPAVVLPEVAYLGDRKNMIFSGTIVTYGRGAGCVVETGEHTVMGKIAGMLQEPSEPTPLQVKLDAMGKQIAMAILGISVAIFLFGLIQGIDAMEMFLTAVSLAVAAIPEGLPAVVTISLALGLQRMVRRNALLRKLPAVEALGSATVICTDKTGTLTKGEMTVVKVQTPATHYSVTGEGFEPRGEVRDDDRTVIFSEGFEGADGDTLLYQMVETGVICSDAHLSESDGRWEISGTVTEGSIHVLARKLGISPEALLEKNSRIFEISFDSSRKMMCTVNRSPDGSYIAHVKGAPERLLSRCGRIMTDSGPIEVTDSARDEILASAQLMASRSLRTLSFARKTIKPELAAALSSMSPEKASAALETDLVFLGLVGIMDPPRPDAMEAIKEAQQAGIRVVMITGDHQLTAESIAEMMGIIGKEGRTTRPISLTGVELDQMDDKELYDVVGDIRVYARVSPEHKRRIVSALKERGEIVAMTGDGVNDAPALKKADIGIAMGITGTDVTKEAADMVLLDDNFASIVHAIEEGRAIYDNIRKFVNYLLSCNSGEVMTMFLATMIFVSPEMMPFLLPIQILWMNLVTDGLPALALGVDPPDNDLMQRPPRRPDERPITREMFMRIALVGGIIAIGTLFTFWLEITEWGTGEVGITKARTVAFTTVVMFQMFYVLSARSFRHTFFSVGPLRNKKLLAAMAISILLQAAVLYIPPVSAIFRTVPLDAVDWLIVIGVSSSVFIIIELLKAVKERMNKYEGV